MSSKVAFSKVFRTNAILECSEVEMSRFVAVLAILVSGFFVPYGAPAQQHPSCELWDELALKTLSELRARGGAEADLRLDVTSQATDEETQAHLRDLAQRSGIVPVEFAALVDCPYQGAPVLRECGFREAGATVIRLGDRELEGDDARMTFFLLGGSAEHVHQIWNVAEFLRSEGMWRLVKITVIATT